MLSGKAIGAFIFSSIVVLTVANHHYSLGHMLRRRFPPKLKPKPDDDIGELVTAESPAYRLGLWRLYASQHSNEETDVSCELEIINDLDETVLLCWVTNDGSLKHYRPLNDNSIKDRSVSNVHVEYTYAEDHFVCIRNIEPLPTTLHSIKDECFVFSYIPLRAGTRHSITLSKVAPKRTFSLRGAAKCAMKVALTNTAIEDVGEVIDSSQKYYDTRTMCGFTIHYEPGVFEVAGFESAFVADLAQLTCLLPENACAKLQSDTPIYVNLSLTYGTSRKPVFATSCCYHPHGGADWLRKNGLNVCKEACVEIFSAEGYLRSRDHWGTGGVLVHEFSHVYHDKHCEDGYDCEEIRSVGYLCWCRVMPYPHIPFVLLFHPQAYNAAMKAKLYDCVQVHGPQGVARDGRRVTAKAYACTNCMEFFAELSVAYLYCLDEEEYNKWFPHNRGQLRRHDPASYAVLEKVWKQYE
jgi:hypothetical protein